jgi:peptidoglycan/LPS O-acetylase OafA/YrhL
MKKVSINLLTNVILLLAGVILMIFHNVPDILLWGCRVMGAMFMLPAVVYLIMVAVRHTDACTGVDYMGVLPAVGGLCFGLVMILKPDKFDGILQLLMAVLLIVLGLFHVIYLMLSRKSLNIKGWYFICPIVVAICGMVSLMVPSLRENVSAVVLMTGICLLLFNFTSLQEYLAERRGRNTTTTPVEQSPISDDV